MPRPGAKKPPEGGGKVISAVQHNIYTVRCWQRPIPYGV